MGNHIIQHVSVCVLIIVVTYNYHFFLEVFSGGGGGLRPLNRLVKKHLICRSGRTSRQVTEIIGYHMHLSEILHFHLSWYLSDFTVSSYGQTTPGVIFVPCTVVVDSIY